AQADIFGLGGIIYEMATGRRAFEGKSQASLIAAILTSEPATIQSLRPMSPPMLDRAVRRCLAKDPEARWQSVRDLLLELQWITESGSAAEVPTPGISRRRTREWIAWVATGIALTIAAVLAIAQFRRPTNESQTARFSVPLPGGAESRLTRASPNGRYLSFTAVSGEQSQVWLRALDDLTARPLSGTEGARFHFWSP